jgi:hypothetical protein
MELPSGNCVSKLPKADKQDRGRHQESDVRRRPRLAAPNLAKLLWYYALFCENKGLLSHPYTIFWMGHRGQIEALYTSNKKQLHPDVTEDMGTSYSNCCDHLETVGRRSLSQDGNVLQVKHDILRFNEFCEEENVAQRDLAKYSHEELSAIVDAKGFGTNGNNGTKVIPTNQLKQHTVEDLEFVQNSIFEKEGEVIVRIPR